MNDSAKQELSIDSDVELFVRHLDSLRATLPMAMALMQEIDKISRKELEDFETANCTSEMEEKKRRVQVPIEHYKKWKALHGRYDQISLSRRLIPRSFLVSMVSQYDAFLGRLLRTIFTLKPELLHASEKNLSFAQIATFPSIEAIRDNVIEKEVEDVLRQSHTDQFKWMETRFKVPLTKGLATWPFFVELTQRRNLFVHTDGIVSSQYMAVCRQNGVAIGENISEGVRLEVPQSYFVECHRCLFEIGVKLAHVLWRKLFPGGREAADGNLINITYELLERKQHALAIALLDFACETLKEHHDERNRLVFVVNRAQAYNGSGIEGKVEKLWPRRIGSQRARNSVLLTLF